MARLNHTSLVKYASQHMKPRPRSLSTRTLVQASDPDMEIPTKDQLISIVDAIRPRMPNGSEYTQNGKFDCDDFAFSFKGLVTQWYQENRPNDLPFAIGIGWGQFSSFSPDEYHALNWVFLADDRKLYWIEPQMIASDPLDRAMSQFSKTGDRVNLLIV
ncbi:lectin MOA-related protein [uncultured Roseobacter sp.]|uniref:lectin MOA-related protein n=1 Tax=uncultured Roseobacter sp. TaxID=114847 RepID=UPI0026082428|nr:lectin MOA-related protein [uncultured Roseobacter sp.]